MYITSSLRPRQPKRSKEWWNCAMFFHLCFAERPVPLTTGPLFSLWPRLTPPLPPFLAPLTLGALCFLGRPCCCPFASLCSTSSARRNPDGKTATIVTGPNLTSSRPNATPTARLPTSENLRRRCSTAELGVLVVPAGPSSSSGRCGSTLPETDTSTSTPRLVSFRFSRHGTCRVRST